MDFGFEYKVCCGNCHVLTATKLLAAIESVYSMVLLIIFMASENTLGLYYLLIKAFALACLFYALKADDANYMLPQVAANAIDMFVVFVALVKFLMEQPQLPSHQTQTAAVVLCIFVVFILAEAWNLWSLLVAFRCYQYLKLTAGTEGRHNGSTREPLSNASRSERTF